MTHAALDRSERKFAQKRGTPLPEHIVSLFDDDFLQAPEHAALLSRVSLVVAMHADGATEAAGQWAHRRQLPVVAVPCCVFPSRFPGRRLRDGRAVVSRHEFVTYLCETYALRRERIGAFGGANVACFSLPA